MDEQTLLRILRNEPDNDEVRLSFWDWIEATHDHRAPFVRLVRERLRLQKELEQIDAHLRAERMQMDAGWIDLVFPLRVRSPMVGRCYTKPTPDAAPFVTRGSWVAPGMVVCLIEAMHVFNEITADYRGFVSEVVVENGAAVEYNQILFRLSRPALDFW